MSLEFKEEMLIPTINGEVYFQVYEIENWMRRICLTAYMKEFGIEWKNHIPSQIISSFKSKSRRNDDLFYLDLDADDNLIWMATHGELMTLILNDEVSSQIKHLTGFNKTSLSQKLDELRHVRNILAHNRPLTNTAITIVTGIIASLNQGIKVFKSQILYPKLMGDISVDSETDDYFNERMDGNDWLNFQAFIYLNNGIYSIVCLPTTQPRANFPSAYQLLAFYKRELENIMAFTLNKTGSEYTVLFPATTARESIKKVIDVFIQSKGVDRIWTNTGFSKQNPKYVCNPKIWFYENQEPVEE